MLGSIVHALTAQRIESAVNPDDLMGSCSHRAVTIKIRAAINPRICFIYATKLHSLVYIFLFIFVMLYIKLTYELYIKSITDFYQSSTT